MTRKFLILICLLLISFCLTSCEGLDSLLQLVNEHEEVTTTSIVSQDDNTTKKTNEDGEDCPHEYRLVYDNTYHFYVCTLCGDIYHKEEHKFGDDGKCSVCGYSQKQNPYTITLDALSKLESSLDNVEVSYELFDNENKYSSQIDSYYNEESGTIRIQKGSQVMVDYHSSLEFEMRKEYVTPHLLNHYDYKLSDNGNTYIFNHVEQENYYLWFNVSSGESYIARDKDEEYNHNR